MIKNKNIAFIGAGFMGGALIGGLVNSRTVNPKRIVAADPAERTLAGMVERYKIGAAKTNAEAVVDADIVVFAVKPQALESVIKKLGRKLGKKKLIVSIAAGVTTASLAEWLPAGARVVRAMPNMAAMVGQAATALCAGAAASQADVTLARQIFDSVGESVVVEEKLMDAVTGLSGSGPAFVFVFLDALMDAGVKCGLTREVARELAGQTLFGAAKLARDSGESPSQLKDRITSPGGTTIAGLASLENDRFRAAVINAVEAAVRRSKELGS